jgi:hypothetical protein
VETHSISREREQETEVVSTVDLVVGFVTEFDPDASARVCDSLRRLSGSPRIAVLQTSSVENQKGAQSSVAQENASVPFVPSASPTPVPIGGAVLNMFAAYRSIFATSQRLGARACCILASKLALETPQSVCQVAQALLEGDQDLAVPRYASQKLKGLLNSSVISPLVRSLYGKRIRNPMGPDLGVSRRLLQRMLGAERAFPVANIHPLASLAPTAVCDNLKICEVHVGARVYPAIDWANISSLIAQVLGPMFLDMDRNAACWQRIRGSAPVAEIGTPVVADRDAETVNIDGLVEWFQLGNRELQEIWGLVLPPATLLELRKLSRLSREQFHMPDQLWVRSIYDFALAHRLQIISRDHLLKSITPLYLGWVASYAKDLQAVGGALVEQRLERLSLTYEAEKPYLVSRWRWPDRFSP